MVENYIISRTALFIDHSLKNVGIFICIINPFLHIFSNRDLSNDLQQSMMLLNWMLQFGGNEAYTTASSTTTITTTTKITLKRKDLNRSRLRQRRD